jgi:plastocyanin
MTRKSRILAGIIGLTMGCAALPVSANAAQAVIDQKGLKFIPNLVTINAGDTILFKNSDPFTHDVTVAGADGKQVDKGMQHHGQDLTVAFPEKGTFAITCSYHPNMKATVTVK